MSGYRPGTGGVDGPQAYAGAWDCVDLRAEIGYLARLDRMHGDAILRALARAPMWAELTQRQNAHGKRCTSADLCAACLAIAAKVAAHTRADNVAATYGRLRTCVGIVVDS